MLLLCETGAESPPEQSELFTEVGTYPIVKQPMTIRMFAPQFPTIEDMKTNAFTVFLEEKRTSKSVGSGSEQCLEGSQTANARQWRLRKSSCMGPFQRTDEIWIARRVIPLNDLIEQYAPNIKKAMQDIPYMKDSITAPMAIFTPFLK